MIQTNTPPLLPPDVYTLLTNAFGLPISAVRPTFGGFSNLTVGATIGTQPCIIKAANRPIKRADLRREALVLGALQASSVPVARLLNLIDDAEWTVAVLAELPGQNGLRVLEQRPAELPNIYSALGTALASAHSFPLPLEIGRSLSLSQRVATTLAELPSFALEPSLEHALASSLRQPIWASGTQLIHGDIGLHNLLWNGTLTMLDWEWASLGPPALDLAWLRWTLRWRNLPDTLWAACMAGYQPNTAVAALDDATMHALMLGQIAMILGRVRGQAVFAEWLRRATWTITLQH